MHVYVEDQATIVPVLRRVIEEFPAWRQPGPAVLNFDFKDEHRLTSFIRRNFGASTGLQIAIRDNRIPSTTVEADNQQVMRAAAHNQNLVLPIHACSEAPRKFAASTTDSWRTALSLFYGRSPWNFVDYWNCAHFEGSFSGTFKSFSEMLMTPDLLEDNGFYEAFLELIRRRFFSSNNPSQLRLVSCDETPEHMREVANRICKDLRWNMHPLEPVIRVKGELPQFEKRRVTTFFLPQSWQPQHEQVPGNNSFLQLDPPVDARSNRSSRWIAELLIENPSQELYYTNRIAWWKLPKKLDLANLFVPHVPTRLGNDHLICAEISGEHQGILLNVPALAPLFHHLLVPRATPSWARELDPSRPEISSKFYIRSSDKGSYARGVLALFESLQKAAYFFEHDFWREVIESLASPVASSHTRNKVRSIFKTIDIDALRGESGLDRIVDEVVDAAGRIQRPIHYVGFDALWSRYWAFVNGLTKDDQLSEISQTDPRRSELSGDELKEVRGAAHANLREMLSEMTARKLFLQGAEIQCNHCLASLWYHIDDLRSVIACRGCRKDIDLPAETQWSYALNELVVSAVRDHGVAPVIRTAYRLWERSKECFCFLPGLEVRDAGSHHETQVCELDLVWIRDGEFGIAEIKRTPKKFIVNKKLALVLGQACPDRFLLVSSTGTHAEMENARSEVQSKVSQSLNIEAWDPASFANSCHRGWNTQTYSILG
jgi:hypothetical protein